MRVLDGTVGTAGRSHHRLPWAYAGLVHGAAAQSGYEASFMQASTVLQTGLHTFSGLSLADAVRGARVGGAALGPNPVRHHHAAPEAACAGWLPCGAAGELRLE